MIMLNEKEFDFFFGSLLELDREALAMVDRLRDNLREALRLEYIKDAQDHYIALYPLHIGMAEQSSFNN